MKQILTYINQDKKFNEEHQMAVKIQVDNSLRLGWKPEDIILATNFDYEYKRVKSIIIGDENYCQYHWPATKIYVIVDLFKRGLIKKGIYWYHDFDCFQLNEFTEKEIGEALGESDMGVTNYGRMPRLCSASIFFKGTSKDIFERLKECIDKYKLNEETGLVKLIKLDGTHILEKRIKLLNLTYALHKFNVWHCYCRSNKPIRAVHFHLTPDKYDFWVKGNNKTQLKIIPEELVEIFNKNGFKG
jgi:hypothetical protein